MGGERKPQIKGRVSEAEHAAATRFAAEHNVSIAGLMTALCRWLESEAEVSDDTRRCIKALVEEARRVDDERGSRKPPPRDAT